jgi:urea transport system permease protein
MDLVWGYCGILSLGHFAFFGLGGYMIGMWLMYARTEDIVVASLAGADLPPTSRKWSMPSARRSSAWSARPSSPGSGPLPTAWLPAGAGGSVPGLLALVFGWLAFRSRVTGVYLSILTQAMTLALSLYLFQNDSGLRGNNGLSGLQNLPGMDGYAAGGAVGLVPLGLGAGAGLGYMLRRLGGLGQVRQSSFAASATTRRGCGSSAIRWRATSWSSSP